MHRIIWILTIGLILMTVLVPVSGSFSNTTPSCGSTDRTARIRVDDHPVSVELAITGQEKICGLSFRDALADDHGMLFVYSTDRFMTFWMKDTRIPLSIAFVDAKGVILNIHEMKPMDSRILYRSAAPARYALEMPAKWFADHRAKAGHRVLIELPAKLN